MKKNIFYFNGLKILEDEFKPFELNIGKFKGTALEPMQIIYDSESKVNPEEALKKQCSLSVDSKVPSHDFMSYTTSLDTLEKIFSNKTLRASSLIYANLNDPLEKERAGINKISGSRFIICFCHARSEKKYFWDNYGGADKSFKVCMRLPNFSDKLDKVIHTDYALLSEDKKVFFRSEEYFKTINVNGIPGKSAGVAPVHTDYDIGACIDSCEFIDIKYISDKDAYTNDSHAGYSNVNFGKYASNPNDSSRMLKTFDTDVLGREKVADPWTVEEESRLLFILSSQSWEKWQYIDIRLQDEFFRNAEIILSPESDAHLREKVEAIISNSGIEDEIKDSIRIKDSELTSKPVHVTAGDLLNNPGVAPEQIAEVKSQYHSHKLSSVTISSNTLICTFLVDPDPFSIFYTPLEEGKEPVREYRIEGIEEKDIEIAPDALAVKVGETLISSETIFSTPTQPNTTNNHRTRHYQPRNKEYKVKK